MIRLPESYRGQVLEAFSSKVEPFYLFPWRDLHFIGPTETIYTDDPNNVKVEEHEIDYIFNEANILFPQLNITRENIEHYWCGVRPTSTINGKETSLPVRLSEHSGKSGIFTLTGPTIMLHRHASRLITNTVEDRLGKRGEAPIGIIKEEGILLDDIEKVIQEEHVVKLSDLVRR